MKLLLGLIFGALIVWCLIVTSALDDLAIFFIAGVVPGTDMVLSPFVMYGVLGILGFSIFLLLLAQHLPRRVIADKAPEAEKEVVIKQHEQARLQAKVMAAKRRKRTTRLLWLQAAAYRVWNVPARAIVVLLRVTYNDLDAIASALRKTLAPSLVAAKQRATPHVHAAYAKGRATTLTVAAQATTHAAKAWKRAKHKSKYVAHGTVIVAKGKIMDAKHTLARHQNVQHTIGLARTKIKAATKGSRKSLSKLVDTTETSSAVSDTHKASSKPS